MYGGLIFSLYLLLGVGISQRQVSSQGVWKRREKAQEKDHVDLLLEEEEELNVVIKNKRKREAVRRNQGNTTRLFLDICYDIEGDCKVMGGTCGKIDKEASCLYLIKQDNICSPDSSCQCCLPCRSVCNLGVGKKLGNCRSHCEDDENEMGSCRGDIGQNCVCCVKGTPVEEDGNKSGFPITVGHEHKSKHLSISVRRHRIMKGSIEHSEANEGGSDTDVTDITTEENGNIDTSTTDERGEIGFDDESPGGNNAQEHDGHGVVDGKDPDDEDFYIDGTKPEDPHEPKPEKEPQNCTTDEGVYKIGERWYSSDTCQNCQCSYSWDGILRPNCHSNHYCPRKPHKDCVFSGINNDTCCNEYYCDNTTCHEEGKYYAIGEEWTSPSNSCLNHICYFNGNATVISSNVSECLPTPPGCRVVPITGVCCSQKLDCHDEYLIVTPKKWIRGYHSQVCVFNHGSDITTNITVTLKDTSGVSAEAHIEYSDDGNKHRCENVPVPENIMNNVVLVISGNIGAASLYESHAALTESRTSTFVQPNKYYYKAGETVHFRVLTVMNPYFMVSTDSIEEIRITSPEGDLLKQWSDVSNPHGILQLEYALAKEVEGPFKISVSAGASTASTTVLVEEYKLPTWTVKIILPPYTLGDASEIKFQVCAEYVFGKPVKGTVTYSFRDQPYHSNHYTPVKVKGSQHISGCSEITVDASLIGRTWNPLLVEATVLRDDTVDDHAKANTTIHLSHYPINLKKISGGKFSKPGLPTIMKVQATYPNSAPVPGILLKLCVNYDSKHCKNYTTDTDGFITPVIPSHLFSTSNNIVISYDEPHRKGPMGYVYGTTLHESIIKHYSPSKSHLSIKEDLDTLDCSPESYDVTIPISFVANDNVKIKLYYQTISRSQITSTGSLDLVLTSGDLIIIDDHLLMAMQPVEGNLVRGVFHISIPVSSIVSPKLTLLVWYVRDDGEVVSAYAIVEVSKCLRNPTHLVWNTKSDGIPAPKDNVDLTLTSSPNSFCALDVGDKSAKLLAEDQYQSEKLTSGAIFKMLKAIEPPSSYTTSNINDKSHCYDNKDEEDHESHENNFDIVFRPNKYPGSRYADAVKAFDEAGVLLFTDLTVNTRPCEPQNQNDFNDYPFYEYAIADIGGGAVDAVEPAVPEMEGDGDDNKKEEGATEAKNSNIRDHFPETWLWELSTVGPSGEVVKQLQFPDTVTEWVANAFCAHPELGLGLSLPATIRTLLPFFLQISSPASIRRGEEALVGASVFNYLNRSLPVTVTLQKSTEFSALQYSYEVCILSSETEVLEFAVQPSHIGVVNLTFTAKINTNDDDCGGRIEEEKSDIVIRPLFVKFEGVMKEKTKSAYLCADNGPVTWLVESVSGAVTGSDRSFISVSGDLLGPSLGNLGHLVRMPHGCGEQNMLNFAPNIFIKQYLIATNQLTSTIEAKLDDYMNKGYQRELQYRHKDGSYSAFGDKYGSSNGSAWLTAFVLKSFTQAKEFIQVDDDQLALTTKWLLGLSMKNGCFKTVGEVFHKEMQGGAGLTGSITVYVVISLLEANIANATELSSAIECITANESKSIYINSLKAYALALSGDTRAIGYIDSVYADLINPGTRASELSAGTVVESAGYLLLAMVASDSDDLVKLVDIVGYISNRRNSNGGFVSTQDTVVGLQALAAYSKKQKQQDGSSTVSVTAGADSFSFSLTPENNLLLQTEDISETLPFNVKVEVSGERCAIVTMAHRYNVPYVGSSDFAMNLRHLNNKDLDSSTLEICIAYLPPEENTNMAIISIEPLSGTSFAEEGLNSLVKYDIFKRFDIEDDGEVNIYLASLGNKELCFSLKVKEDFAVPNRKNGTVTVYAYYSPERTGSKIYGIPYDINWATKEEPNDDGIAIEWMPPQPEK